MRELIITDENHHCLANSYKRIYEAFPDTRCVGVTATMPLAEEVGRYKHCMLASKINPYITTIRQISACIKVGSTSLNQVEKIYR